MSPAVVCSTTVGSTGWGGAPAGVAPVGATAAIAADCGGEPAGDSVFSVLAPALLPQPDNTQRAASAKPAASVLMRGESMIEAPPLVHSRCYRGGIIRGRWNLCNINSDRELRRAGP